MNGNYRNRQPFLLSPSSSAGSAHSDHSMSHLASLKSRFQQHQQSPKASSQSHSQSQYQACGLPSAPVKPSASSTSVSANIANNNSNCGNKSPAATYHIHNKHHQQSIPTVLESNSEQRYINDRFVARTDQSGSRANRIMPPEGVQQFSDYYNSPAHQPDQVDEPSSFKHYTGANSSDHYVNQLRHSQLKHSIGLQAIHSRQPAHPVAKSDQFQHNSISVCPSGSTSEHSARDESRLTSGPTNNNNNNNKATMHVNFNRSRRSSNQNGNNSNQTNPADDYDDEEEEHGRKKKYLTAKYGQQQMNLIKKRLKIETWLYEQLQELAKCSKSEVSGVAIQLFIIQHSLCIDISILILYLKNISNIECRTQIDRPN